MILQVLKAECLTWFYASEETCSLSYIRDFLPIYLFKKKKIAVNAQVCTFYFFSAFDFTSALILEVHTEKILF